MRGARHSKAEDSARETSQILMTRGQFVLFSFLTVTVLVGFIFDFHQTLVVLIGVAMLFSVLFVGMKLVLSWAASRYKPPEFALREYLPSTDAWHQLPVYTIFVPLFKEANMLESLVEAIDGLRYPKHKLEVQLLLEAESRDPHTLPLARQMECQGLLPTYFKIVEIPDEKPYGKPKALNIGLAQAQGEFSTIYDAEDRPESNQLLKAVDAFRKAAENVACVQARLFFWNGTSDALRRRSSSKTGWFARAESSAIKRMFWVEYAVHFERVLPGFTKLGLIPPLGGTSNHFRTDDLCEVNGWDAWNVTEDADLAGALAQRGKHILMIDSVTEEEATANLKVADGQRRRWLKGYLQTGLVYTRQPLRHMRQMGPIRWFAFVLQMLGTPISLLLTPIFWALTITYVFTRSTYIESLFPWFSYYPAQVLFIGCNIVFIVQYVGACYRHQQYSTVFYIPLLFVWWTFTSWSMVNAVRELATPKNRYLWHKTDHGHDLVLEAAMSSELSEQGEPSRGSLETA